MPDNQSFSTAPAADEVYKLTETVTQLIEASKLGQATSLLREANTLAGDDPQLRAMVCAAEANLARRETRYVDALQRAHLAHQLLIQTGDTQRQASILITIGMIHFELGDYGESVNALSQAVEQAIAGRDRATEAAAAFWLGACYQRMSLFEQALAAISQSETLCREDNDPAGLARALNCRHIIYREMSLRDEQQRHVLLQLAQQAFDQANHYAQEAGHEQILTVLRGNLGRLYAAAGEYERALEVYEEQLRTEQHYSPLNQSLLYISRGTAQRHLGHSSEALKSLRQALEIAEGAHLKREIALAHQEVAETFEVLGDATQALQHYKQYHQAERVMLSDQNERVARVTALRLEAERGRHNAELQSKLVHQEREALREKNELLEQLIHERTTAFERQNEMLQLIDDLSTPILPLLRGVLVMPVVGSLDSERCTKMTTELLQRVSQEQARVVLLDITGVLVIDSAIAAALVNLARAIRLLGCQMTVVGIRPEIAEAMVSMGLNLSDVASNATLAEGLSAALQRVGMSLVSLAALADGRQGQETLH